MINIHLKRDPHYRIKNSLLIFCYYYKHKNSNFVYFGQDNNKALLQVRKNDCYDIIHQEMCLTYD